MGLHSALENHFFHLVLFDTETTGIQPEKNHIIELGESGSPGARRAAATIP